MKRVVVDASVAAKWFIPEAHSDEASRLLELEAGLFAPDLIGPEFSNIIWKKLRRAEITRPEADEIMKAFATLPLEIQPSAALLPAAFEIAAQLDRSVYDSLYLALAVAEKSILVTADSRLYGVVSESPLANHIHWVASEE